MLINLVVWTSNRPKADGIQLLVFFGADCEARKTKKRWSRRPIAFPSAIWSACEKDVQV